MVALYVGGQKVEWADAEKALTAPGIDWPAVTIRDETGRVVGLVEPPEDEPEPLVVDESR
jgi:hypothetical protein